MRKKSVIVSFVFAILLIISMTASLMPSPLHTAPVSANYAAPDGDAIKLPDGLSAALAPGGSDCSKFIS